MQVGRTRWDELKDDLIRDYKISHRKSRNRLELSTKHLQKFFEGMRAADITTTHVNQYIEVRQEKGAENATINRELSALKRMLPLGKNCCRRRRLPTFRISKSYQKTT